MRVVIGLLLLLACACAHARERERQVEFVRKELSYLVPFVDLESEEKAVRNVLAQRKLVVEDAIRGPGFVALSATTLDHKRSAVRVITGRGVVAAEDGDEDELFGARQVALMPLATGGPGSQMLLGIARTERGQDLGCARYYRVRANAMLAPVDVQVDRFGSRACLVNLARDAAGTLLATIGWPTLSAGTTPSMRVDMLFETDRVDQTDPGQISVRIDPDENKSLAREITASEDTLARAVTFPERQAVAVVRAALALGQNQGVDQQLGAYQSALGQLAANSTYADWIAFTREHIQRGWDDLVPEDRAGEAEGPPPDPSENVIIDPGAR